MAEVREDMDLADQPLKTLCLYYLNSYGHQIWQGGDLLSRAPAHKVT